MTEIKHKKRNPTHISFRYDWRNTQKLNGWRYKGDAPDDPEYLKDRQTLFAENGNGWWWGQKEEKNGNQKK